MTFDWIFLWFLAFAAVLLPSYWWIMRHLKTHYPHVLTEIDHHAFRAMFASSQLRFFGFLLFRAYAGKVEPTFSRFMDLYLFLNIVYAVGFVVLVFVKFADSPAEGVRPNTRVEPTAQNLVASLPASWVPSLRSAAAHAQR